MFNWIQTNLTKHYKWFLFILLVVLIVPFVFTIGNFSPWGGGGPSYKEQPFFQYDLSSIEDQRAIFGRGQTSMTMNLPSFYGNLGEAYLQSYSLSRAAYLYLADQLNIPSPSKEAFKEHAQSLAGFMNFSTQEFDATQWTNYVNSLAASGLSEVYVTRVIEEDYRVNKVRELLGGPGHILQFEAIRAAERQNTEWTVETASMDYSEFAPEITVSDEDIEQYFETNSFRYEVAQKTKASYLLFDPAKHLDEGYNPESGEKSIHFFTHKARYQAAMPKPKPIEKEDGTTETPETLEVTLEEVEDQVIAEIRLDRAKKETQKMAEAFAYRLFDLEIENGSPEFEAAVNNAGLQLNSLVPYSESTVATQNNVSAAALRQIFRLTRYFSDPIENGDNFVIIITEGTEPAYIPELPELQAGVKADLTEERKRTLFIEKGAQLKDLITKAIKNGDTFEAAAQAQKLNHKSFEVFKQNAQPPEGLDSSMINQLPNLEEGAVSEWIASETNGTFLFAAKKTTPTFEFEAEEVISYVEQNTALLSASNVEPIVSEILMKELEGTAFEPESTQL